jgi:iron complex outermembrane recepter protein
MFFDKNSNSFYLCPKKIMFKALLLAFSILPFCVQSQNTPTDSLAKNLETVVISATRLTQTDAKAPLAVTILDKNRLQTATQQLSPYEVLGAVPGVFAMNPDNFAQDLRISIRGFGARAAFGIRGIRIFTDGLPEGTPDGQADVDNLDMGIVRSMEVLRGVSSGLYGNASGGVIYMLTENASPEKPILEAQISAGSYGFQRYQLKIGQKINKFGYFINGSANQTKGYRAWSSMQNQIFNAKMSYDFGENTKLTLLGNFGNSNLANDPGALTEQQIEENPRQAGSNNLLFETGEKVRQGRIGATFESKINAKHSITARTFYTSRSLINRLAIASNGYGDLQRNYYGFGFGYQWNEKIIKMPYRLKVGLDLENQADTRQRFAYLKTFTPDSTVHYVKNTQALNQLEQFKSTGIYLLQDLQMTEKLLFSVGVRFDDFNLSAKDSFLNNGNQSGKQHFSKINPMIGIGYSFLKNALVYTNFSTNFETPTLNELSNNPSGTGGFNPTIIPQQAQSLEIGAKGTALEKLQFDFALYQITTQNDLVPYQILDQPNKVFYRNAGKTIRKGVEIGLSYPIISGLKVYYTQTFSDFKYKNYLANGEDFSGKDLPGIPKINTQLELRYAPTDRPFFASLQGRYIGKIQVNDANTATAKAYSVLNLRLGSTFSYKKTQFEPFLGINNLTNTHYIANVQINAQADRYFEPAALQYLFGGIKIRLK